MCSKADISQLNLSHGTKNFKKVRKSEKKVSATVRGVSLEEEKEGCGEKDLSSTQHWY